MRSNHIRIKASVLLALMLVMLTSIPAAAAGSNVTIFFDGVQQEYNPAPQIINGRVLVPMTAVFEALGAQMSWDAKTRSAIAFKDGKNVSVQIGSLTGITADATYSSGQYLLSNPQNVKLDAAPIIINSRTMVPLSFVSMALGAEVQWYGSSRQVHINTGGKVTPPSSAEMRGAWMSYNDLAAFNAPAIDAMLDKAVEMRLNTIFVHARAFSDAFYKSDLFPWSHKLTGVQGRTPSVDPLQYVIDGGHRRGLRVEAWINPYRISNNTELTYSLAPDNPAVKWLNDPEKVIQYEANGQECLIYNPASQEVRDLITGGILEIVNNYDVDGIHFDDYFYVTGTGEGLNTAVKKREVNKLVRQVYAAVKGADPDLSFGISPAGNIGNCRAAGADIDAWLSQDGFVDYVCPQIYWTNEYTNLSYQFDNCLIDWMALKHNPRVKLYVGLALYRVGTSSSSDPGWSSRSDNIASQVRTIRDTGECSGFILFDISNLLDSEAQPELAKLRAVL